MLTDCDNIVIEVDVDHSINIYELKIVLIYRSVSCDDAALQTSP